MNPAGVMIHKMQLAGDIRQKNAFLHALDNQCWLEEDSQKIIFIRKISVQGQWWELAGKIAQQANQWAKEDSQSDELVVFHNYAQMATEFIRHLLAEEKPWYLVSWIQQQQIATEPLAILTHKVDAIPSILDRLQNGSSGRQWLREFFIRLDRSDFKKLQESLMTICPALQLVQSGSHDFERPVALFAYPFPAASMQWIKTYLNVMVRPGLSKKDHETVLSIVCCFYAWRFYPTLLKDKGGFIQLISIAADIYRNIFPVNPVVVNNGNHLSQDDFKSESIESLTNTKFTVDINKKYESGLYTSDVYEYEKNLEQFLINQTGFLFLLNLMKTVKPDFSTNKHIINPWVIVWQVFQRIAQELTIPPEDSLFDLCVGISHLEKDDFCSSLSIENQEVDSLFNSLKQKLQRLNLWCASWINLTSRVELDQAYVNIYLDNSSVQIDLRMAGLDVNPGWVPWLGRVIYFHYGYFLELVSKEVKQ